MKQDRRDLLRKMRRIVSIPAVQCALLSFFLTLTIEILCRRSLISALLFLFTSPFFFLVGWSIVMATLSLALLCPKRGFLYLLISTLWFALGVTNCVLVLVRTAPFEAVDLSILRTGLGIITIYMEIWQIILVAAAILGAIAGLVVCAIKMPKQRVHLREAGVTVLSSALLCTALIVPANLCDAYPNSFPNLTDAYDEYGFVYCFSCSIFDRGVDKPENYSEQEVEALTDRINAVTPESVTKTPNVIFLQLESFIDVNRLDGITFTDPDGNTVNPIPYFTSLKQEYGSGLLRVPTIGAGTANTEFEMITGMSQHDFGTGEYPYKSFLKKEACESLAFLLKGYGYGAHAIHNHTGTFYERNKAYASLGFDTFTSVEHMANVEYNSLGWAKDAVLTEQIMNALLSTDSSDLVLTISVQGHGKYKKQDEPYYRVVTDGFDEATIDGIEYYVNQLAEMDIFLRELTAAMSLFDEDVILVMYGDHLPSLGFSESDLTEGDLYETDYVIWTNCGIEYEDRNLTSYQLAAYALLGADISTGHIFRLHQTMLTEGVDEYHAELQLLEYDMLDGKRYIYGGERPYEPTDIRFGVLPVTVTEIEKKSGGFIVYGENFTASSEVFLNGKKCKTSYDAESGTLKVRNKSVSAGDKITVRQITADGVELGRSEIFVFE